MGFQSMRYADVTSRGGEGDSVEKAVLVPLRVFSLKMFSGGGKGGFCGNFYILGY